MSKKLREVDKIILKMGVTEETLAREDFGSLKLSDILMDRNNFTEAEWKSIEKDLPSLFIPSSLSSSIQASSVSGVNSLSSSIKKPKKAVETTFEEERERERKEKEHQEELARIIDEFETGNRKVEKSEPLILNESEEQREERHPFEVFEEEGQKIVASLTRNESMKIVTKYLESKSQNILVSNFEKGEMMEFTTYISNARQSVTALCVIDELVGCGLENGSMVLLFKGKEQYSLKKLEPTIEVGSSPVSSIDITSDKKFAVAGYENGFVVFWDCFSKKVIKSIKNVHHEPVVQIKAYFGHPAASNGPCCISSDAKGETSRVRLDERMFMYFEDFQVILKEIEGRVHHLSLMTQTSSKESASGSYILLAYASESMIIVLCVEPELRALFQFNRPEFIREKAISHVGWATGLSPSAETQSPSEQSFLVVGWGKSIMLFLFDGIKENLDVAMTKKDLFKLCGRYEHSSASILFLAVIGESRIAILDGDQKLSLLFTGGFKPYGKERSIASKATIETPKSDSGFTKSQSHGSNTKEGSAASAQSNSSQSATASSEGIEGRSPVVSCISAMEGMFLKFHMLLKDPEGHPKPIFTNHVTCKAGGSTIVFCDNTDTIFYTKIYTWEEYIESLIENGEWIKAMTLSLELYKGKSDHFGDIGSSKPQRKAKVREVLKRLCSKYTDQAIEAFNLRNAGFTLPSNSSFADSFQPDSPNSAIMAQNKQMRQFDETICWIPIDILVTTKLFDFLFLEIAPKFQHNGLNSIFLKALEPFILSQKIKRITDEFLKAVCRYYKSIDRTEVIQALIMSLDPSEHDLFFLLQICLEYKLFTTLIYICPRNIDPDFATPFVKLYSEARASESQNDEATMAQQLMRMLWYLNMTIKGERFPHEPLGEASHMEALSKLLPNILNPSILSFVIQRQPKYTFEVLLKIFNPELYPILYEMNLPKMSKHTEIMKTISDLAMNESDYVKCYFFLFVCDAVNTCNMQVELKVTLEVLDFFTGSPKEGEKYPRKEEIESRVDKLVHFLRQYEDQIKERASPFELQEKAMKCSL